ncbi:hypothetical protein Aple_065530 [Acrocarpospora pleiomorpha]|uniref:Uncharacterized protein n=1 Tax=Acrocarpospora pleiomorpha TaxID=90975 RepID=A0A5M3XQW6_9ACTN|nr:hypothetical protein Aple_065530 [Acrocarpospora pleiomorpha]
MRDLLGAEADFPAACMPQIEEPWIAEQATGEEIPLEEKQLCFLRRPLPLSCGVFHHCSLENLEDECRYSRLLQLESGLLAHAEITQPIRDPDGMLRVILRENEQVRDLQIGETLVQQLSERAVYLFDSRQMALLLLNTPCSSQRYRRDYQGCDRDKNADHYGPYWHDHFPAIRPNTEN